MLVSCVCEEMTQLLFSELSAPYPGHARLWCVTQFPKTTCHSAGDRQYVSRSFLFLREELSFGFTNADRTDERNEICEFLHESQGSEKVFEPLF